MEPAQERAARIGLAAVRDRGYALGGSNALGLHGIGTRPSGEITDPSGQSIGVDAIRDYRAQEPVETEVGPILHRDDAVAAKMQGIYDRGAAKDFIDVQAAMAAGYSRERLLELGDDKQVDAWIGPS